MKFTVVAMFIAFNAALGVESKSVEEPSEKRTGHSFPIKSGDNIALRSAFTRGQWLKCTRASCVWTNCRSSNIADPTGSASCPERMIFTIKAKDGGVINSGDTVSLSPIKYGPDFLLSCDNSTRPKCCVKPTSDKMRARVDSLTISKAFFQIYSRDAEDGTPVENHNVVRFKYPYSSNRAWLSFQSPDRHFYPLPCSSNSKIPCAEEDKFTGFVIYKLRR
ncbi:uncharacterized protein LOC110062642 [Orbicella faveolata]|uniref:uncharacterized protein LOC110062642 n=1 Tax=Orbicella faveolata TaxID=48498 RepID=UPI0009E26C0E|nr:uncharacterized protein LOC110062642 [Orbicella faveolata]